MIEWQTILSLFAAFLAWASGANIVRIAGNQSSRNIGTLFLGLIDLLAVHIMPFLLLPASYGILAIVIFYVLSGIISGLAIGVFTGAMSWPENFIVVARYGPILLFGVSLVVNYLIYWNFLR